MEQKLPVWEEGVLAVKNAYLLGMDIGTTNIKAIITTAEGERVAAASRANRLLCPGRDMAEQDAAQWWGSAVEIFHELGRQAGADVLAGIRGIAVSSQTVTLLPLDEKGMPLRHAIIWMDGRSGGELKEILEAVGRQRFAEIVGGQPDVAFLPSKLLWFKRHEPELYARTACLLQANGYVNYRLTGRLSLDMDQAVRTQCMELSGLCWSKEIGGAIGADLERLLPAPRQVTDIIGAVTEAAAAETGLPAGVPVAAGCCDALAAMYATGLCEMGEAGESSGTTSLIFVGSERPSAMNLPVVARPCPVEGIPYFFDAPVNTTGASVKWYLDTLGAEEKRRAQETGKDAYTLLNELAAQAQPGSGGLVFLPYLRGERAPLWNPNARGAFLGLTLSTQRQDMMRAVFEGTAYALRHVMETIEQAGGTARRLRVAGGGAKSVTWAKIKASVLNMPVLLMDEQCGDVPLGDVLIAGQAAGVFSDISQQTRRLLRVRRVVEPEPAWSRVYDKLYPLYRSMYRHLEQDYEVLSGL